ncbi:hypothetical protein HK101_004693 [Irineochytrium annulatum]|nr:hypothetical protein HK101_004693 [Irineochytrium annulatum]
MNMVAGVSFESGFFKTIDEITEPFYRTSPTVKEDPIISFMILYALYRVALIRGELVAIAEWQQAYDPRSAAARAFNFGIDARECLDAMIAAHKGDIRGALGHMEGYLIAFSKLEVNGDVADTAMFVPYPIILIFDPVRSGLPLAGVESSEHGPATPWTHDEVGRMKAVVVAMKGMMKAFGIVYHHVSSFWIIEIYEAIELLLDGRKKEAITVIKRKLRSRRKSELEGLVSLKAMYHGLIAKYSDCNGDGAKSRAISSNLFNELKSQLYLRWLES